MKKLSRKFLGPVLVALVILPLVIVMTGCGGSTSGIPGAQPGQSGPIDETPDDSEVTPPIAMPSPPMLKATGVLKEKVTLEVEGQVTREVGKIVDIDVYVTNASAKEVVVAKTVVDGTFDTSIAAKEGNLIIMMAIDSETGQESNVLSGTIPISVEGEETIIFVEASTNDYDGDGVNDAEDAFPTDPNEWKDVDGDGIGDKTDNCLQDKNYEQTDTDGDGSGDACDADDDNDGILDINDAFPTDPNEWVDTDGDGIGNKGDNCPLVPTKDQTDTDGDKIGDVCDADDDNDGVADSGDAFPLDPAESKDSDGDGIGDNADTDDDNDGVADLGDAFPFDASESADADGDGVGDNADTDDDNDGVLDGADNCQYISNADQADADSDGLGNVCDNCPDDANADQKDLDNDGTGDVCDADRDGDGMSNADETATGRDPDVNEPALMVIINSILGD